MNLSDIFITNCKATSSLIKEENRLSFKDLTSGLKNTRKNGTIARFSFDDFFIDLYFIENGPLAYVPNTIWINVGFWSVSSLPFSIYDIFAYSGIKNFKCYTYQFLNSSDILIESFGEINELFKKTLIPLLTEISKNGTKKNLLINSQKETINFFIEDNIFQEELEIFEATAKIKDLLIRNFIETNIAHVTTGGISEFFNGNKKSAVKKLTKLKKRTSYENMLLAALTNNELNDFDASAYRDSHYKNHLKTAKNSIYKTFGLLSVKFFAGTVMFFPLGLLISVLIFFIFSAVMFRNSLFFAFTPLTTVLFLISLSVFISQVFYLKIYPLIKKSLKNRKKKEKNRKIENFIFSEKDSKILTIFYELIIVLILFFAVNSTVVFYPSSFKHPDETKLLFALKQETSNYAYIKNIEKEDILTNNFIDLDFYTITTANNSKIQFSVFFDSQKELLENIVLKKISSDKN